MKIDKSAKNDPEMLPILSKRTAGMRAADIEEIAMKIYARVARNR